MEVVLAGRSTLKARAVLFQVLWLIKTLKIDKHKGTIEVIPKRGLSKMVGGVGVAGSKGDRMGFAYDTSLGERNLMRTVSHEMVHIKQLAKGQLRYDMVGDKEVTVWKGKPFDVTEVKYIDRPWELEAYSKQEVLVHQFTDFLEQLILESKNGRRTKV